MKEKILITGTTGFVGSHLTDLLLKKSWNEIYGIKQWNNTTFRNVKHFIDKIKWYDCDVTDSVSVRNVFRDIKPDKLLFSERFQIFDN